MLLVENVSNLVIFLTDFCNFSCKYCVVNATSKGTEQEYTRIEKFLKFFSRKSKPGLRIDLTGGEPTFHKDFEKIVDLIETLFISPQIFVTTNGSFPLNNLDSLLKTRAKFIVTFEGLPEIQNFERPLQNGQPSSELVLSNIKKILKVNPNKLSVRINLSTLKIGKEKEISRFFKKIGVENVFFSIVSPEGRGKDYENADVERCSYAFSDFEKCFKKEGFNIVSDKLIKEVDNWPACGGDNQIYSLTIDSKIIPCSQMISSKTMNEKFKPMIVGEVGKKVNIFEETLKDYQQFSKQRSSECENCSVKLYCGGCPMMRLLTGSWEAFCKSTKKRLEPFLPDKKV